MTNLSNPSLSRAVLIGCHAYTLLDDLPAVKENLTGLQGALTDPAVWGLPTANCTILSQPRNQRHILEAIHTAAAQAQDTVLVYYAGHGLIDPHTEELCLSLPDSDSTIGYTTLRYEEVRRVILGPDARAERKVVILDCCFSGRAMTNGMNAGQAMADEAVAQGTYILTSAAENVKALAPANDQYTVFTGELITTLTHGIPDGPRLLNMGAIFHRLDRELRAKSRPHPQQRNRNTGDLIAIGRNRAYGAQNYLTHFHKIAVDLKAAQYGPRGRIADGEMTRQAALLSFEELLTFAESNHTGERMGAAIGLGVKLRDSGTYPDSVHSAIGRLLDDHSSLVRYRAAQALLRNPVLIPGFRVALEKIAERDGNAQVRGIARKALDRIRKRPGSR